MAFRKKTPIEKLKTKINKLVSDTAIVDTGRSLKVRNRILFSYNAHQIKYSHTRYYPTKKIDLVDLYFSVAIPLNDENIQLLSGNPINPPISAKVIIDLFRTMVDENIDIITIGASLNALEGHHLSITKPLYLTFAKIYREEGVDKRIRFKNRAIPFINDKYQKDLEEEESSRDYSLLLDEIIASGEVTQKDILSLAEDIEAGDNSEILIQKQVSKQVEWLIESIQSIIDEPNLTKPKAKKLGKRYFNFSQVSISGPEHLMEKILTKYGKHTLFGMPALINTDKYVVHAGSLSRSQFDIILINHLSDIELVELKRPDEVLMKYDSSRNKFYASKDLSIAVSQAERYISAVLHENDDDFLMEGKKVREYLDDQLGGTMSVDICRPTALIIMGSHQTISKAYDNLSANIQSKISKDEYDANSDRAYKEFKGAFKNINITTYSELLDSARTRILQDE